ncbi:MAG TPA: signal peptidase I, partial [Flavobacterium sp.]|nr:signal peptidase I [Flavobacterium sp.]
LYVVYVNYTQPLNHIPNRSLIPENRGADTISSLLFAIVVATLVHTYVMQPFTIPSASLEKSLLIGDYLFVSKFHYGARTPMTAVALPMVHDSIPLTHMKSYSNWPQLPYFRFPGLQKIERNDIVVFNWPVDTVYKFFDTSGRKANKPIDKKSNYVKRCVGAPGDSLSIRDGFVFINGKKLVLPERAKPQYSYTVTTNGSFYDQTYLVDELHITDGIRQESQNTFFFSALTDESVDRLKNNPITVSIVRNIGHSPESGSHGVFPQTQTNTWNRDNYGPIYIPQEGKKVALNLASLPYYSRIIKEYEGHDLKVNGNEILIDGKPATTYTFAMDYYWMMGDNRHNSEDSRYWGYVPANHVVGKPVFIWLSRDANGKGINKIRWDRMFTTVSGEGERYSYLKLFVILLAAYFGISYYLNKRKEENS